MNTRFATPYNIDTDRSVSFMTHNNEESMTQQSDKDDCDINIIMEKYNVTGQLPGSLKPPMFGDFSETTDYRNALDKVNAAKEAFGEIPAKIRKRFNNDPAEFIEFVQNPENQEELIKMGLANRREVVNMQASNNNGDTHNGERNKHSYADGRGNEQTGSGDPKRAPVPDRESDDRPRSADAPRHP